MNQCNCSLIWSRVRVSYPDNKKQWNVEPAAAKCSSASPVVFMHQEKKSLPNGMNTWSKSWIISRVFETQELKNMHEKRERKKNSDRHGRKARQLLRKSGRDEGVLQAERRVNGERWASLTCSLALSRSCAAVAVFICHQPPLHFQIFYFLMILFLGWMKEAKLCCFSLKCLIK